MEKSELDQAQLDQAEQLVKGMEKQITKLDDGMVKIDFQEPLKFGEKTINSTTLRKAKAKDLKGIDSIDNIDSPDTVVILLARLGDNIESTEMAGELDWCDLMVVMKVLNDFLLPSRKTGKTA